MDFDNDREVILQCVMFGGGDNDGGNLVVMEKYANYVVCNFVTCGGE